MTLTHKVSLLLLTGLLAASSPKTAHAQNLIQNGSFETGTFTNNGADAESLPVGSTAIDNWTVVNAELAWATTGNPYGLSPSEGSFFLDLTGYHDNTPYGGVSQTIATNAGESYVLAFDLGADPNGGIYGGPVSILASTGTTSETFSFDPTTGSGTQYQTELLDFTAMGPSTAITLTGITSTGGQFIGLDNVEVTPAAAVPEASTTVSFGFLLTLGLGSVVIAAKKKAGVTAPRCSGFPRK